MLLLVACSAAWGNLWFMIPSRSEKVFQCCIPSVVILPRLCDFQQ